MRPSPPHHEDDRSRRTADDDDYNTDDQLSNLSRTQHRRLLIAFPVAFANDLEPVGQVRVAVAVVGNVVTGEPEGVLPMAIKWSAAGHVRPGRSKKVLLTGPPAHSAPSNQCCPRPHTA